MDPLSIQMVMGSPPMLRSKISLSSLVGLKKKSPGSDKSFLLKTPTKLGKIDEDPQATPSRADTVRRRRGFRPLSIMTNSVLLPFEFDPKEELEAAAQKLTAKDTDGSMNTIEETSPSSEESRATLTAPPHSNDSQSDISLRAFLAQSSPPLDTPQEVRGSFSTLYTIPPPDVSQHPSNSQDPFASQSDSPSLITTSSPDEIRSFASQTRDSLSVVTNRRSSGSDIFRSADKKKYTFFEKFNTPISTPKRLSTSTDSSPLARRPPKSCPIEVSYISPATPTMHDSNKKRTNSGGVRKLSDVFKSRIGSGNGKLVLESTETPPESPTTTLKRMEEKLRTVTCSPTYVYTDNSWLPRHPNTGRFWRSRNLKCTNCLNVCCACCGRTCCAYRAAVMALETHKDNPIGRAVAVERIQQITTVFPYGREMPTFLKCTSGVGNGSGCGKMVCPDCCGVCPEEACSDIQCRKCKKNPWDECEWHSSMTQRSSTNEAMSIRHTV